MRHKIMVFLATSMVIAATDTTSAQDGRMSLIVGYNPGGGYDFYARAVAMNYGRFLPGSPVVIVKHMPGAGSVTAANYLYAQAPKDGSTIGIVTQAVAFEQRLGANSAVRYDAGKFNWIGRVSDNVEVTVVWHTSPVKTIEQARLTEMLVGATSPRAASGVLPTVLNRTAGTRLRLVMGYKGTTGALNAMEQGEVQGSHAGLTSLRSRYKAWFQEKKLSVLVQYSLKRHSDIPDVPTVVEAARPGKDRAVATLVASSTDIGRAFLAPPGVPADKLMALRESFGKMMADAKFKTDLEKLGGEVNPLDGAKVAKLVADVLATPEEIVAEARRAVSVGGGKKKKKKQN